MQRRNLLRACAVSVTSMAAPTNVFMTGRTSNLVDRFQNGARRALHVRAPLVHQGGIRGWGRWMVEGVQDQARSRNSDIARMFLNDLLAKHVRTRHENRASPKIATVT